MRRGLGGILALMIACCSRDQTFPVDGAWLRGGISGDHFGVVVMLLRQEGNEVTGSACFTSDPSRPAGDGAISIDDVGRA